MKSGRIVPFSILAAAVAGAAVWAQPAGNPFLERAREALAEPFVGVTLGGAAPEQGLFEIEPTGVSTEPVRQAALALIDALDAAQRERLLFPVDDDEWRNWANIHRFPREGVSLDEMTPAQRDAAYALLEASLSAKGYETSRDIMRLNHHLAELVDNFDEYGEHLYWFTIFGEPSATEPWGWQIDGHHLVINYFVLGDQVVMTPTFMGSEPVTATSGKYAGTTILEVEQDLAVDLMASLDPEQRDQALLSSTKSRGENLAEMFRDNIDVPLEGLPATRLDAAQRERLLALIEAYVGNMDDGHAAVKMDEVRAHLDRTYFAWKGEVGPEAVFYYRIVSPVLYIEFDHQGPTALAGPRNVATRNHIHTVVRTPNGNDYGRDLLRQHYEAYRDDPAHGHVSSPLD
ncbi:MAG TPA: DUF3500 domain-containing protein [Gammaproteobacteria bacterium]